MMKAIRWYTFLTMVLLIPIDMMLIMIDDMKIYLFTTRNKQN